MKTNLHHLLLCGVVLGGATYSDESEAARVCRTKITLPAPSVGTCDVDSTNPKMGNPFAYIDPTQGCDFNFSLPGLPSFSLEGLQGMLCEQIQDIGQQTINEALGPLLEKIPSSIDLDMNEMMSKMFDDQMKMQREFCPVYNKSGKLISYECENAGGPINPGMPDWAIPIVDPDNKERECYELGGVTYCKPISDGSDITEPDRPYNPDNDMSLPHCSDLTDFFDSEGNLIPCRNSGPRDDAPASEQSQQSSTTPTWDSNSGSNSEGGTSNNLKPTWDTNKGW
ncbi:hypothetical protein OCT63_19510 [Vibrio sp. RW]|uniref:hypothetical protein n=1 Tax=Vibrio sp. RW TaxID=2998833 RepID=UPI0022CD5F50|nr:hypothetical protein [Vibrio sp. RW]MDA0146417.1 hypothetical protein [Vibrio sp. RW]